MPTKSLVTGANGHLGNTLVRLLVSRGEHVIAGIRNAQHRNILDSLGGTTVRADLLDRSSLAAALQGVEVLYQVGAVFKHWAPNPERDIYAANMNATRNVLEAAAHAGVRRVVYVSSLAALDRARVPINESSWNPDRSNIYFRSKTDAEKLAWDLAEKHRLNMVSVLPGAMIGRNCLTPTPTMALLTSVIEDKLPVNPGFFFNFMANVICWRMSFVPASKNWCTKRRRCSQAGISRCRPSRHGPWCMPSLRCWKWWVG